MHKHDKRNHGACLRFPSVAGKSPVSLWKFKSMVATKLRFPTLLHLRSILVDIIIVLLSDINLYTFIKTNDGFGCIPLLLHDECFLYSQLGLWQIQNYVYFILYVCKLALCHVKTQIVLLSWFSDLPMIWKKRPLDDIVGPVNAKILFVKHLFFLIILKIRAFCREAHPSLRFERQFCGLRKICKTEEFC